MVILGWPKTLGHSPKVRRANRALPGLFEPRALDWAAKARRDDRPVYFALNLFEGRQRYQTLPPELQRDIKALFGSYTEAQEAATSLLFSTGDPVVIQAACEEAYDAELGWLDGSHSLTLHQSLVERLPPALRAYVGCAGKLFGALDDADLVKIHIRSGKLTLLRYDDFAMKAVPILRQRNKINLRTQQIDHFDHAEQEQCLCFKSRYVGPDWPDHAAQAAFDRDLAALALAETEGYGLTARRLEELLAQSGRRIGGLAPGSAAIRHRWHS